MAPMLPHSEISLPVAVEAPPAGVLPPGVLPPGALPPGALPPGTLPPGTLPASASFLAGTDRPEAALLACRQLLDAGARLQAAERLQALAALCPDWPDPLALLAELHLDQGDSPEAEAVLRRLVALAPAERWAAHRLAEVLTASGAPEQAAEVYAALLAARPDDRTALRQRGLLLHRLGQRQDAVAALRESLLLDPADAEAGAVLALALVEENQPLAALEAAAAAGRHDRDDRYARELQFAVGSAREALGETAAAVAAYRRCLTFDPLDRFDVTGRLARLQEAGVPAPTPGYVRALFDRYAERFDESLVGRLGYRGPEILATLMEGRTLPGDARALDLGCGTGLAAPILRPRAAHLVGVDLSGGMLAQARRRALYDELHEAELETFLAATPGRWDLVVALDVLNYVGPLAPAFRAVAARLAAGGLFALTLERSVTGVLLLQESRRYAHGLDEVEAAAGDSGLRTVRLFEATLRRERDVDVPGYALLLERPAR